MRQRRKPMPLPLSKPSGGTRASGEGTAKGTAQGSNAVRRLERGPHWQQCRCGTRSESRFDDRKVREQGARSAQANECPPLAGEHAEPGKVGAGGDTSPHYFVGSAAAAAFVPSGSGRGRGLRQHLPAAANSLRHGGRQLQQPQQMPAPNDSRELLADRQRSMPAGRPPPVRDISTLSQRGYETALPRGGRVLTRSAWDSRFWEQPEVHRRTPCPLPATPTRLRLTHGGPARRRSVTANPQGLGSTRETPT